ncbi:MAG: hypothetical protein AUJ71_01015 [Candidatus Omnitrophica bacterium CG1_02_49_16]|nr:MAG: hypothetical protein AUJ71_01015 [Candidatus Omnitrophica bacterium CG1_02_49_16]
MASGTFLTLGSVGTATTFPTTFTAGHTTLNAASTVLYQAGAAQNVSGTPTYGNLTFTPLSGTPTYSLTGTTVVSGSLTISGGTLTTTGSNYSLTISSYSQANGTFTANTSQITCNGNFAITGGTYNADSSTLTLDATSGDLSLNTNGYTLNNVIFKNNSAASARTITLGSAGSQTMNFAGYFYLNAANSKNLTVTAATYNPTINIMGTLDYTGVGTGTESISMGNGTWMVGGNVDLTNGTITKGGSTLLLNGSLGQTITSANQSFNNITITNASAQGVTFANSLDLTGLFTDTTSDSKLTFNAGATYTFANISIAGTSGHLVTMTSTGSWNFNVSQANSSVSYAAVNYSNASGGNRITATDNDTDNGNNINWAFPATYLALTGSSSQTAGGSQTITITAYSSGGSVATGYSGDKFLTFSGANPSTNPVTNPTASNKGSSDIDFGSSTTVAFTNGAGTSDIKLYRAETAAINVTDQTINATGHELSVSVSAGAKNKLLWVSQPSSPVASGSIWNSFSIEITDAYGNRVNVADLITVTPSSGSFGGTAAKNASAGLATFDDITYPSAATVSVSGAALGLVSTPDSNAVQVTSVAPPALVSETAVPSIQSLVSFYHPEEYLLGIYHDRYWFYYWEDWLLRHRTAVLSYSV